MFLAAVAAMALFGGKTVDKTVYLSDILDRIVVVRQGWGALGIDECAHELDKPALPMQIGAQSYSKGLGSHAAGAIAVDLLGEFDSFDAEVGVQKQGSPGGSVVFRVAVDGNVVFTSPTMTQDSPALPIHVPLKGAQELALIADPAGDGVTCDCANWAEARLAYSDKPVVVKKAAFDMAPFATVCTWDPKRVDGARASRIEEYLAEDVYLDQPLKPVSNGSYKMPASQCIGLVWMDQRRPSQVSIEFSKKAAGVALKNAEVYAWEGPYPFQGTWKRLEGKLNLVGKKLSFDIDYSQMPEFVSGFRKVRWVLRSADATITGLSATQSASLKTYSIFIQSERVHRKQALIELFNATTGKGERMVAWDTGAPFQFKASVPTGLLWSEAAAKPAIRVHLPDDGFAVEIEDLICDQAVYLPDQGVLLSIGKPADLEAVKKKIASKQTVLQRVRQMPDQSLAQAMAKTYRSDHDFAPLLLSLGENNWKWLVLEDGTWQWMPGPEPAEVQLPFEKRICSLTPRVNGQGLLPVLAPNPMEGTERWMPVSYHEAKGVRMTGYAAPVASTASILILKFELDCPETTTIELPLMADRFAGKATTLVQNGETIEWRNSERALGIGQFVEKGSYALNIEGGQAKVVGSGKGEFDIAVPGWEARAGKIEAYINIEPKLAKDFADYWSSRLADGMQFGIPDRFLSDVIRSSIVRCIVDSRNTNKGQRIAPWIAEIHYGPLESEANTIIRGMGLMGYEDFAQKSLDFFAGLYNKQGFLTTGYTVLGTGWHLWTLGEFYAHSPNPQWLKGHAAEVERVCDWVVSQRKKTMKKDAFGRKPIQYGLMTPGVIADWNAFQYYFYSNGMYCMGLETVGKALTSIGRQKGQVYTKEAMAYRKDIVAAYRKTQAMAPATKLLNGAYVPGSPSQTHCPGPLSRYYGGDDGNRSWAYDVEIGAHNMIQSRTLPADGTDSKEMADYLEDIMFLEDGWGGYPGADSKKDWFNLGGFAKVQPYYARLNEVYAMRDDVKPFIRSYFNALASLVVPSNLTIWEHFDHYGAPDKTHETGVFLQQTRFMLVDERGGELWLAPFVTNNWMKDGMVVSLSDAPTRFGKVSYRIESHVSEGYILATLDLVAREKPKAVVIRLRHPDGLKMKKVLIDGKPTKTFDAKKETVRLKPTDRPVVVRAVF